MTSGKFLQSDEWQKFQESLGRKTWRVNGALVIKMNFLFGLYFLYSPKGPLFEINDNFLKKITEIAKQENAFFYRTEPSSAPPKNFHQFRDKEPRCTLITDISKTENELLAGMHEKTRYNIRLAERKKLLITNYELRITDKGFNDFYNLLQQTSKRQKIKLHSREYYRKLTESNKVFVAHYEDKPVACAMVNFYEDTATYLHGGSDEKYKNLMAPQLLHWEIIKIAKSRGIKFYDWWGIDEKRWPGITRFKRGFGGKELCAPGTFDLPINKFLYKLYGFFRK